MIEFNEQKSSFSENNRDFSYDENKSYLKISFERIAFIFFIFFVIAIIFSSKVVLLSLQTKPEIKKVYKKKKILDLV